MEPYSFYNEQIWDEAKNVMNGKDISFKPESFYTVEYGTISHKAITGIYKSKFKAEPFKIGSGIETKRGLRFSKEVLDRIAIYYNVPDEIKILQNDPNYYDNTNSQQHGEQDEASKNSNNIEENNKSATHATDATHYNSRQGIEVDILKSSINKTNDKDTTTSTTGDISKSYNNSSNNTITNTDNNNVDDIHRLSSKCVACVATVAESNDHNNRSKRHNKADEVGLPEIPCLFSCGYKDCIDFDLSLHYLEYHKPELFTLSIGKGSMEYRADYAVAISKKRLLESFRDDEEEEQYSDDDYN